MLFDAPRALDADLTSSQADCEPTPGHRGISVGAARTDGPRSSQRAGHRGETPLGQTATVAMKSRDVVVGLRRLRWLRGKLSAGR